MNTQQIRLNNNYIDSNYNSPNNLLPNATYKGTLSKHEIKKIQKRYSEYLDLQTETGVPWKLIAAMDLSVTDFYPYSKIARQIQKIFAEHNINVSQNPTTQELVDLINKGKELAPNYSKKFDLAYNYYIELEKAFL